MQSEFRLRRCSVLFVEPRETLDLDLAGLLAGGDALASRCRWVALAPHLGAEVEIDDDELAALGRIGETPWRRHSDLASTTRPEVLARLREAGLSRQKISYIRDLSERVADGRLVLDDLEHQSDQDVETAITAVKGFGRWSAEMFLMFRLNRPDVFPVGDLGIVKGVQRLLGMKSRPSPRTMLRAAEAWRPYRTVAAWYLWRIGD